MNYRWIPEKHDWFSKINSENLRKTHRKWQFSSIHVCFQHCVLISRKRGSLAIYIFELFNSHWTAFLLEMHSSLRSNYYNYIRLQSTQHFFKHKLKYMLQEIIKITEQTADTDWLFNCLFSTIILKFTYLFNCSKH